VRKNVNQRQQVAQYCHRMLQVANYFSDEYGVPFFFVNPYYGNANVVNPLVVRIPTSYH
jgi:hypothetical protein